MLIRRSRARTDAGAHRVFRVEGRHEYAFARRWPSSRSIDGIAVHVVRRDRWKPEMLRRCSVHEN